MLSDQPFWRQWPVRFVNWLVSWNGGPEIQGSAIAFSRERAIELASRHGFFKMELPLDRPLPEGAVQFGDNNDQFPDSPQTFIYSHGEALTAKPCAQILAEQEGVEALTAQVDRIREKLRSCTAAV